MKLCIYFLTISYQKHFDMDDEHKLPTFYKKHMATELVANDLMESGRIMLSDSVVGMANKVFPWIEVFWEPQSAPAD